MQSLIIRAFQKLNEANEIIDSIQGYIEDAIRKLDEVVVPDEDIEDVTESVAGENNKLIGSFITVWREFENAAYALYRQNTDEHSNSARIGIFQVLKSLLEKDLINNTQHNEIDELRKLRNSLVHSVGVDYPPGHIEGTISTITQYTNGLQQALRIEEADHLEKIRDKEIVATYEKIKGFILMKEGVELKINKHYISFVKNGNFVDVKLQQSAVKIWLNLNKGELDDPRNIAKDVSNTGHLGNGDYEVSVKGLSDFSYISGLIDQAYKKAANKE
jgi:predicted transport protein